MKVYSHRGNLSGRNTELENHPEYIQIALDTNHLVEIDLWADEEYGLWLGHDVPQYKIESKWIDQRAFRLIIHTKNFGALSWCRNRSIHHFFHENDDYTISSQKWTIMYPDATMEYDKFTIMSVPEVVNLNSCADLDNEIGGVITDFPENWDMNYWK